MSSPLVWGRIWLKVRNKKEAPCCLTCVLWYALITFYEDDILRFILRSRYIARSQDIINDHETDLSANPKIYWHKCLAGVFLCKGKQSRVSVPLILIGQMPRSYLHPILQQLSLHVVNKPGRRLPTVHHPGQAVPTLKGFSIYKAVSI